MSLAKKYTEILEEYEAGAPLTEGIFGRKPANMKSQHLAQAKWARKNMAARGKTVFPASQMYNMPSPVPPLTPGMATSSHGMFAHHPEPQTLAQMKPAGPTIQDYDVSHQPAGYNMHISPGVVSFNDFQKQSATLPHRQYSSPIGPEYQKYVDPNKPFPGYKGYGEPLRNTPGPDLRPPAPAYNGPRPTYDRGHLGPSLLRKFRTATGLTADNAKKGAAWVGDKAELGAEKAFGALGTGLGKAYKATVTNPLTTRQLRKQTRERIKGRLGLPASRIVNDIVAMKKSHPGMEDFIDYLAHDYEKKVQDLDYSERQALKLAKIAIEKRYKQIGKTLAKQQGRREAWNVIKRTPIEAWTAYHTTREKGELEARAVRDAELRSRSGAIQKHIRDMDRQRDIYMGDIEKDISNHIEGQKAITLVQRDHQRGLIDDTEAEARIVNIMHNYGMVGQTESLELTGFFEGKARSFKELMRNKAKVRARYSKKRDQGVVVSVPKKKSGRKKKKSKTAIERQFIPTTDPRNGRKTTLAQRHYRIRRRIMKNMQKRLESFEQEGVGENYYGKHPVLHTTGQVVSIPVTVPAKVAKGVARFTGLNQLPQAMKDAHSDAKHHFVHGFLLR